MSVVGFFHDRIFLLPTHMKGHRGRSLQSTPVPAAQTEGKSRTPPESPRKSTHDIYGAITKVQLPPNSSQRSPAVSQHS